MHRPRARNASRYWSSYWDLLYGSRSERQDNLALILPASQVPKSYGDFVRTTSGWTGLSAIGLYCDHRGNVNASRTPVVLRVVSGRPPAEASTRRPSLRSRNGSNSSLARVRLCSGLPSGTRHLRAGQSHLARLQMHSCSYGNLR